MNTDTIQIGLFDYFMEDERSTILEATTLVKEQKNLQVNDKSIRAKICEGLELGIFKRVARGVYKVESQLEQEKVACLLINGDGHDSSFIEDNSIDRIITDHLYDLTKSLTSGNREFATYELFEYAQKDFQEKIHVLKEGAFCIEFLPEENEVNYQYLYKIKQVAIKEGSKYFTRVPWTKNGFKANTGRKSKNRGNIMFSSRGEPHTLKLGAKRNIQPAKENGIDVKRLTSHEVKERLEAHGLSVFYTEGTSGMLPIEFQSEVENFPKKSDFQPRSQTQKVMGAEKPVTLMVSIIKYVSLPDGLLLDQFDGSGDFGIAYLNTNRNAIIVEKDEQVFGRMKDSIVNTMKDKNEASISIREVDLDEDMDMETGLMQMKGSSARLFVVAFIGTICFCLFIFIKQLIKEYKSQNSILDRYFVSVGMFLEKWNERYRDETWNRSGCYMILIYSHTIGEFHKEKYEAIYIGQSLRLANRMKQHLQGNGNKNVYHDYQNERQVYIHLERCMPSYMNRVEEDSIRSFKATRSYNIQEGGGKRRRDKDNFKYR